MKTCIYCKKEAERFKGVEHVLPKSFGAFGTQTPVLDCVCDECNAFFGVELDHILARETLEGITRYKRGIFSKETRSQKEILFELDEGDETGEFGGVILAGIDGKTGKLLPPVPQFHILNKITGKYDKFHKGQIKDIVLFEDVYGKPGERKTRVFAPSSEEHEAVKEELNKIGLDYKEKERFRPPFIEKLGEDATAEIPVSVFGTIDTKRKRVLAKILFNFTTFYAGQEETLKAEWGYVRRFIRYGDGKIKGRMTQKPFWDGQETDNLRFKSDSYNVRIENQDGNVAGVIQFFNLFTYEFILVEGHTLPPEKEAAYRFTPGEPPYRGTKMPHPQWI